MSTSRRPLPLLVFFSILVVVSVLVAVISVQLIAPHSSWRAHDQPHGHQWLHKEIDLTVEEAAAIDAFEAPYREKRAQLQKEFNNRVQAIAALLENSDQVTPAVTHAVHELHLVHGQLQELSIAHYFEMLSVLPPEKQDMLRKLAVDALSTPQ
jgi:Spy/CpxP family protein refolding chaperone